MRRYLQKAGSLLLILGAVALLMGACATSVFAIEGEPIPSSDGSDPHLVGPDRIDSGGGSSSTGESGSPSTLLWIGGAVVVVGLVVVAAKASS